MKILFLNLPYKFDISRASRWPEKTKSGTMYYPYWICYAAGVCIEQGFEVDLVDCIARKMSQDQVVSLVKDSNADFVMGELTTSTCEYDFETLNMIKAGNPDVRIIVGGTHATVLSEEVLKECAAIDIVARQEYDFTLGEIMNNNNNLTNVLGITYRQGEDIVKNEDRPWLEDLDSLPMVSRVYEKFLDVNDYGYSLAENPMIQIFSARGCPFRCNFCSYPHSMSGRKFRKRSAKNLVDELEYINTKMPYIKEVFIEDDTFTVDKTRVHDICTEIKQRELKVRWSCNTRVDTIDYQMMKEMKEAGCRLLVVGFESGNQKVLDETKKGIKLSQAEQFSKNAKKLKMKVFGCFMIGLKGDDRNSIEDTYKFAKKVNPDMVFFQQAVPFPGTEFYEWVKENGCLITENYSKWLNKDGYFNCLVDYPYATHEEIEIIRDNMMSRYYFSITYIFKTFLTNLSWNELVRVAKAGFSYIQFRVKKIIKAQ